MPMSVASAGVKHLNAISPIQRTLPKSLKLHTLWDDYLGNPPRNLEAIARAQDKLFMFWRTSQVVKGETQAPFIWHGPYPLVIENANGRPCFRGEVTQSLFKVVLEKTVILNWWFLD